MSAVCLLCVTLGKSFGSKSPLTQNIAMIWSWRPGSYVFLFYTRWLSCSPPIFLTGSYCQITCKTKRFIKKKNNTFFTRMSSPPVKARNKDYRIKGHMKRKSWGIGSDKRETQRSITKRVHLVKVSKPDSKISQDSSSSTNEMAELMRGKAKKKPQTNEKNQLSCILHTWQ